MKWLLISNGKLQTPSRSIEYLRHLRLMIQSSLLRVLIIYIQDFYHLKNVKLKR